ncbi:spore germination protein [Alkalihalobacterium alkalinitrilicum]|uniref:spore germination protein n=1 Tax=Alkalihalobacterium alkalinitrilicum TaxID=427920 RepID=UPI000994D584|nr:spore germination protein [Alkalihalobacterium alkalinitrilicum]
MRNKSRLHFKKRYVEQISVKDVDGTSNKKVNEQEIKMAFTGNDDVICKDTFFNTNDGPIRSFMIYCEGLCDTEKLAKEIIPELEQIFSSSNKKDIDHLKSVMNWKKEAIKPEKNYDQLITSVYDGQVLFFIPSIETAYLFDISKHPQRTPEETTAEISIRGARDGFIEEIRVNTALIRKRVRSKSLKYEEFIIGARSQTKVGLFYIDDIAPKHAVDEIKQQLQQINIDGLISTNQLEELLIPKKTRIFPMFHYTGRPDFASDSLLRGRFIILVDGAPTVLIAPCNLTLLLKAAEDNESYFVYNSLERMLRIFGLLIAIVLPGFWVALVSFHPGQLPFILVSSLAQVRLGVPLPIAVEAIIMVTIFELFREAGLRLPAAIGQIISVVGGLIIGDAAIRAGLTNPAMLVIIATSAIATFSLGNQSFAGTISILRIYVLLLASSLGMFGVFIASFSILLYVAQLRSYGMPYLAPLAPIQWRELIKAIIRPSFKANTQRPAMLDITDKDKSEG